MALLEAVGARSKSIFWGGLLLLCGFCCCLLQVFVGKNNEMSPSWGNIWGREAGFQKACPVVLVL